MIYVSLSDEDTINPDPKEPQNRRDYGNFPFLRNPASIFTPSASISLTDDNSTYFAARPAAFGPLLPSNGLSGQIWIGSGFGDNTVVPRRIKTVEGELGCSDLPGWADFERQARTDENNFEAPALHRARPLVEYDQKDEATDDHFCLVSKYTEGKIAEVSGRTFIEEAAAINGKIVLLSRGGCGFSDKVTWAQRRGAMAVIVGDNLRGGPLVRMSAHGDSSNITIPSLFTSHTTAHLLSSLMPAGLGADVRRTDTDEDDDDDDDDTRDRGHHFWDDDPDTYNFREGLWVTLSPTDMSASPFFNTLFVLVISPLFTLAIVYSMLLLRSRIRRRRWRAPKSVVEQLPVHVYHALSRASSGNGVPQAETAPPSVNTPLLASSQPTDIVRPDGTPGEAGIGASLPSSSQYGSLEISAINEREKNEAGLAEWKRKYKGRQTECVICLEEYVDGVSKVMSLPCAHEFHEACITPWLITRRRTCPICKGDVVRQLGRVDRPSNVADDMTEEELQAQTTESVNDSAAASRPIMPADMPLRTDDDIDLERGHEQNEDEHRESSWFRRGLDYFGVGHGSHDQSRPPSSTTHE
jgi:hypothetical protein